jgi:hypothetical protein
VCVVGYTQEACLYSLGPHRRLVCILEHRGNRRGLGQHVQPTDCLFWSGPLEGIAVSNLRPGYRSHCLNRAKCDFKLSLHSALVNS